MIEVYGFLLAFAVQVFGMSVLHPLRFSQYVRRFAQSLPHERLAQLYPGTDLDQAREKFLSRFRAVNWAVAVLGLALLAWLFDHMRSPDWDEGRVIALSAIYYMVQLAPFLFVGWLGFKFNRTFRRSWLEGKRKASLQRRGLLDFVSPIAVFFAVAGYIAIVPFIILVQDKPFPGYGLLGVLTLTYLLQGSVIYKALYGKKANPLEAPEMRAHRIDMTVKTGVYGLILVVAFFTFVFLVDMMDMKRWVPLAQTICLLFSTAFCLMVVAKPPRDPEQHGPDTSPATSASHR
jgi:hypothetical protein